METVDLNKTEGDGEFPCPKCGVILDPNDESDEVYTVKNTIVKGGEIKEMTLLCKTCKTKIKLVGF